MGTGPTEATRTGPTPGRYWRRCVCSRNRRPTAEVFRIGRVCTERNHRGHGLVATLMTAALAEVGERPCRIEAQTYLTEMYGKFGFVRDGDDYLEDGIPHVSMLRAGSR